MEKKVLLFACKWNKVKERTWSGTSYALNKALAKQFRIEDFNIVDYKALKILRKIKKKLFKNFSNELENDIIKINQIRYYLAYANQRKIIFQFMECPYNQKTVNYIYQDLCVEYIKHLHDKNPDIYKISEFQMTSEKYLEKRIDSQRKYYQHCKGIFTMSIWLADYLVRDLGYNSKKIHSVGGGINVDSNKIDYSLKSGNKILFIGRNFERKAGPFVCKAFEYLRNNINCNAELYILGPSERPKETEKDGIIFVGEASANEVSKYFNLCDIFCMPSYFEAYGLVFAEALCYGLPCIGRNAYAMGEFITEGVNGHLISEDNIEELAKKMEDLLCDSNIRDYVRTHKMQYTEMYSWDSVANKIANIINEDGFDINI